MKFFLISFFKYFYSILFLHLSACTFENDGEKLDWVGKEENFHQEFTLAQTLDTEVVLINRVSEKLVSGVVEFDSGEIITRQSFVGGKLNGTSIKRNKDGSWVEANFQNGLLHGDMKFFDSNDQIRSTIYYQNGKLDSARNRDDGK